MNKNFLTLATLMTLLGFVSCSAEKHFHEDKVFAGGLYVSAKTLNKGKALYTEYCMACHGVNGDGKGVAAKAMKVPPRDFTKGIFCRRKMKSSQSFCQKTGRIMILKTTNTGG